MDKLLKREDVKKCDKWNIESVYGSLDEYNKDYNYYLRYYGNNIYPTEIVLICTPKPRIY